MMASLAGDGPATRHERTLDDRGRRRSAPRPRVIRVGPWPAREVAAARSACCWPTSGAVHRWTWRPAIARSVPTERSIQPPCAGPELSARSVDPRASPRTCRYSVMALRSDSLADRVAARTFSSTSESSPHLSVDRSSSAGGPPARMSMTPPTARRLRPVHVRFAPSDKVLSGNGGLVAYLRGPPRQSSASDGHVFAPDLWRSIVGWKGSDSGPGAARGRAR
jgi:hypothetical protein